MNGGVAYEFKFPGSASSRVTSGVDSGITSGAVGSRGVGKSNQPLCFSSSPGMVSLLWGLLPAGKIWPMCPFHWISDNRTLIWIPTVRPLLGVWQQTTHLDPYSQASPWCMTIDHSSGSLQPGLYLVSDNRPLIWIPTSRPLLGVWQQTTHLNPYSQASTWCLTIDHSSGSLQPGLSLVSDNRPLIWIPTARLLLDVWQQTAHLDPYSQASP